MNEFKVKNGLIVDGPLTASFAYTTASWALNAATASLLLGSVSNAIFAVSSSWASQSLSSSYVAGANVNGAVALATLATTATTANAISFVPVAATSASWVSASAFITTAQTASYVLGSNVSGQVANASTAYSSNYATQSLFATSSISASFAITSSNLIGWNFVNTGSLSQTLGPNSQSLVVGLSTGSYLAVFFDYAAASGSNVRAGTIFGSWVGSSISYAEVSNVDVGNTNDVTMSLGLNGGNVQLSASVNTSIWNIRALGRFI